MLLKKDRTDDALSETISIDFIRPKLMAQQYLKACPTQTSNFRWTNFDLVYKCQYLDNVYDLHIVRKPVISSTSLP